MYVEELRFFNFRNLSSGTFTFSPGVTCVVGQNGQGKTNLIEAISLLSLTRSFRTSSLSELISWGAKSCSVFARCVIGGERRELGLSIESGSRTVYIDGKERSSIADLLGMLVSVTFSPTDISLVQGGPLGRRRFLDRHIVDRSPQIVQSYQQYQRSLRSKSALLQQEMRDKAAYSAWNELLAHSAAVILKARLALIHDLAPSIATVSERLFEDPSAISLRLTSNLFATGESDSVTPELIYDKLQASLPREMAQRKSIIGPHRDDLVIDLFTHEARSYASQGQSRSIVLALKAAIIDLLERERGESPVILLDDVDSELDFSRRLAVFTSLIGTGRQVLITATEYRLPDQIKGQVEAVKEIANGAVRQ